MAEVRGQFFGDVSGKVGGSVFSRAQNGKQLKAYVYLNQAPTSAQSVARSAFKSAKDLWNLFDYSEKKLWSGYADFNKFKGSGYSFYIHCSILGIEPMPGASYSLYSKVQIHVADVLNLNTIPVVLLPAPGVGKLSIVRSLFFHCGNFGYTSNGNIKYGFGIYPIAIQYNTLHDAIYSFLNVSNFYVTFAGVPSFPNVPFILNAVSKPVD